MSNRQYESYQVTAPYQGSTGLAAVANVAVSQTARAINLSDYFGKIGSGHYFTIQADGAKIYVSVAPHGQQAISDATQGAGPAVCYPLADGDSIPFVLQGGRTIGTGGITGAYATNINYASGAIIWAKVGSYLPTGGSATGFLRIWRNSLGPGQGLDQFPPTGF